MFALSMIWQTNAQINNYVFSESTGVYTPLTGATVVATATALSGATSLDDVVYNLPTGTIPFTFNFDGIGYTGLNINSNGYITFGATAPSTTGYTPLSANTAYAGAISAFGRDLNGLFNISGNTAEISYATVGSEFVIQYKNFRPFSSSALATPYWKWNFQIRLNSNGQINMVYDAAFAGAPTSGTCQIGLRGATNLFATNVKNRAIATGGNWNASTAGITNASTCAYSTTLLPVSGKTFTFTPPPPPAIDMAATAVVGIPSSACATSAAPLSVTIKNNSTTAAMDFAVNNATVAIAISGSSTQALTATLTSGTLAIGASMNVLVAPDANFSLGGTHNIVATVTVVGDGNAGNNSFTATPKVIATPAVASGYTQDFAAATTAPAGWNTTGFTIAAAHGKTNNGLYRNIYSFNNTGQFSTITVGPVSASDELKFDYRIVDFTSYPLTATPAGWGNFQVQVSTDCGGTFTTIETVNDSNHVVALGWAGKTISLSAYAGQSVMVRVLATWVAGDYYLDFDNFSIAPVPVLPPNCATALVPADLATGVVRNTGLSWTAATGSPLSYDVYFGTSTSPAFAANVLGTTYTPATLAANTTYYWKVVAKNANGDAIGCSEQSFETGASFLYCTPTTTFGCTDGDVIAKVVLNTLSNDSGTGCPSGTLGYSDYTSNPLLTTELQAGGSYSCTVSAGQYAESYAAWIDYNDDGIFANPEERIGFTATPVTGSGVVGVLGSSASFPIVLSCAPPVGLHRLRVRAMFSIAGSAVTPCGNNSFGEVEDYLITITAADSCPAPATSSMTAVATASGATLGWTQGCLETAWEVVVQAPATGVPTVSGTPTTNPYVATGLTALTPYEFYVRAVCDAGLGVYSSWSGPFAFTTLANAPGCATPVTPANAATGVVISSGAATLTWAAPAVTATEGDAVTYNVFFGTTSGALNNIGTITAPAVAANVTGLAFDTIYYWRIAPVNTGGTNATCAEFSFTTQSDPCVGVVAPGSTFVDAIDLGAITASQTIVGNNQGANCFKDNFTTTSTPGNAVARPGKDVFYKFQITELCNNFTISTCIPNVPVSTMTDSYLHLLDSTGATIVSDDDDCSTGVLAGALLNGVTTAITTGLVLAPGTYYVVVEGYSVTQEGTFNLDFNYSSIPSVNYYTDSDNDGYGDANAVAEAACSPVAGKASNNLDCTDNNAAVSPAGTEVPYDGLDNNCDGNFDEGFPPLVTQLSPVSCDTNLSSIYAGIYASFAVGAVSITGYRFEFTNTSTSAVQTIDRLVQYVHLTDLPTYNYGTTYSVRVMLRQGTIWLGNYGASCTVTSPSLATTTGAAAIVSPACGSTLPTIYASIYTTPQSGVTGYRYRITRSTTSGPEVQILDKTVHYFSLTNLPTYVYGTDYTVEVALKTTGLLYSAFGAPCTFTSPIPTILTCGTTVPATGSVFATATLSGVSSYVFEVTNTLTSTVQLITRTAKSFPVSLITGYSPATTYDIRMAVVSTGVQSPFGPSCSINPSVSARFGDATATSNGTEFKAVGYPNPFETNFTLNVTTTSDEKVQVVVYDMIGKQLESKEVNATDANALEVGANYPSGVYNVVVSQGVNVKSLRMIKR